MTDKHQLSSEKLKAAIQKWQAAHALAKRNPDLLLSTTYTKENGELAEARMRDVGAAERELFAAMSAAGPSEIPSPLLEWRASIPEVGTESACWDCWLSSANDEKKHTECVARIKRFFRAEEAMESL